MIKNWRTLMLYKQYRKSPAYHFNRGNALLNAIITIVAVGVALSSPSGAYYLTKAAARAIAKKLGETPYATEEDIRKSLHQLKQSKFISIKVSSDGKAKIELTKKGRKRFAVCKVDNVKIVRQNRWDEKWRVVIFDIPEKYRGARDALRIKLKELGFFQVQKSAWVYPFPCKDEIDFICEFFGVEKFVLIWTIVLENDFYLRKYFRLL